MTKDYDLERAKNALVDAQLALSSADRKVKFALNDIARSERATAARQEAERNKKTTPVALDLLVPDGDFTKKANWTTAEIKDAATYPEDQEEVDFTLRDMVTHKELLTALANINVGPRNLDSIWENNLSKLIDTHHDPVPFPDEALDIAENRSATGLATTTLLVTDAAEPKEVSVHIILNTETGKGLIVGDRVSSRLSAAFNKAGITYVDRHTKIAKAKIDKALSEITSTAKENPYPYASGAPGFLADAFRYRNDVDFQDKRPLTALLVDDAVQPMFGKYVVKKQKPAV